MFAHKSLATIDYDESKAPYGAPRHIVGDVTEIERYFQPGSLDLIVINGVLGWGLDAPADVEKTLAGFATCLRPGGHLIVGWNDLEGHRPVPFRELTSMRSFRPLTLDCLGSSEIRVDNDWRHVFSLFERSSDVAGAGHR